MPALVRITKIRCSSRTLKSSRRVLAELVSARSTRTGKAWSHLVRHRSIRDHQSDESPPESLQMNGLKKAVQVHVVVARVVASGWWWRPARCVRPVCRYQSYFGPPGRPGGDLLLKPKPLFDVAGALGHADLHRRAGRAASASLRRRIIWKTEQTRVGASMMG